MNPESRSEVYLASLVGEADDIPETPTTRVETYLAAICGQDVELPDKPQSRMEAYLEEIVLNGGTGSGEDNPNHCEPPYIKCKLDDDGNLVSATMYGYKRIRSSAFTQELQLESVVFKNPNQLTEIGSGAFYYCSRLQLEELPLSITKIGSSAFARCTKLNLKRLPDKVERLESEVFRLCYGLELPEIPENVTYFGWRCLEDSKIQWDHLPPNTTHIDACAFNGCAGLRISRIPDSVTYIGGEAFKSCSNIAISELPSLAFRDGIQTRTFQSCEKITVSNIPSEIPLIEEYAFNGCNGLTNIEIGSETIDAHAFRKCLNLKKVWLRSTVTTVKDQSGYSPFYECPGLTIYCESDAKPAGFYPDWSIIRYADHVPVSATVIYGQKTRPW